jgi:hypothetical protein
MVIHNAEGRLGQWEVRSEALYDSVGDPLWFEHPVHGRAVDVVALPLTQTSNIDIYAYDPLHPGPLITFGPSDPLSVIGFPFGRTGGGNLGIWVQGTIATEPAIDWDDRPCFLIDSRTREGQSGSPVILYRADGYSDEQGTVRFGTGVAERFVGIYSGRISKESDLGFVWKASALADILEAQERGSLPQPGNNRSTPPS